MGGNTSLRVYHSFGACVSSYLFALSLEQFVWFICYYGVYETMFYVLYVPCGTLCLFNYVLLCSFMCSWYMCEMAMEFGLVSRHYHRRNSILIELSIKRYAPYKL
jgi:hypothetical protein